MDPYLPVLESVPEVAHAKLIGKSRAVFAQTTNNLDALFFAEEAGSLGIVVDDKESNGSDDEGEETFEDKDPGPAVLAADAVHLGNAAGEQTAKGTGGSCSAEEDGHAETTFVATIPHLERMRGGCMRGKIRTVM